MGAAEGRGTPRRAPDVSEANAGDGGVDPRRVPRGILAAHAVRPARPHSTGRKEQQRLEEEADGVTALLARRVPLGSWFRPQKLC